MGQEWPVFLGPPRVWLLYRGLLSRHTQHAETASGRRSSCGSDASGRGGRGGWINAAGERAGRLSSIGERASRPSSGAERNSRRGSCGSGAGGRRDAAAGSAAGGRGGWISCRRARRLDQRCTAAGSCCQAPSRFYDEEYVQLVATATAEAVLRQIQPSGAVTGADGQRKKRKRRRVEITF